jgi:hypothetical protein
VNKPQEGSPKQGLSAVRTVKRRLGLALRNIGRAIAVMGLIIVLLALGGCVLRPGTQYQGKHFNKARNAVWLGVEWSMDAHSAADVAVLAADLKRHEIRYVYVYTSYLKPAGNFNPTFDHAAEFIQAIKAAQPDLKVLAWIGVPLFFTDIGDPAVRQKIAAFSADRIKQAAFDGVQLDPEPIGDEDTNIPLLMDEVKHAIGPKVILSLDSRTAWPIFPDLPWSRWFGPVLWSAHYYREVAQHVDQIAVMTYDSGLYSPVLYRQWSRFEVIQISKALAGSGVELLFGVPTSEEESSTHHVSAETMDSGLNGIIDGLNDDEAQAGAVNGVAIYPYWETDAAEWALYDKLWLGK